ncbi:response regulator [Paenibacillus sp. JTLBN-2024]
MNILIVEDEASVRDILQSYFLNEGWNVHITGDGWEALKRIQLLKLDLVVLDLMIQGSPARSVPKHSAGIEHPAHHDYVESPRSRYDQRP